MRSSILYFAIFTIILLIVQIALSVTIKRLAGKWSSQKTANSVLLSTPAILTLAALLIGQSLLFFSLAGMPPHAIDNMEPIDSLEHAAKRIHDLEAHTAYLESYLVYERRNQLILVVGLAAIFAIPLLTIGFGIYKPTEDQ